jgi:hypothetical protein
MPVFLRNTRNKLYFSDNGWVRSRDQAHCYATAPKAIAASLQMGIDTLEIVMTFEGGESWDVIVSLTASMEIWANRSHP